MKNDGYLPLEELAKNYAKSIHDSWGIGHYPCDNGVLIFLAICDRQIYISTGRAAASILTDK